MKFVLPLLVLIIYTLVVNFLSLPSAQTVSYLKEKHEGNGNIRVAIGETLTVEVKRHRDIFFLPNWIYLYLPDGYTWVWKEVNITAINYAVIVTVSYTHLTLPTTERV